MEGAWFLGDRCLFQGLKGRLSYSLENKRTGRVSKEPRRIWEGTNKASGQVKVGRQLGTGRGRKGTGRRVWDGVIMSPLKPVEGSLPLPNPTGIVAHSSVLKEKKQWKGSPSPPMIPGSVCLSSIPRKSRYPRPLPCCLWTPNEIASCPCQCCD